MNNKKDLYIENSLIGSHKGDSLLGDIYIEHNSLPEMDFDDIDTSTVFMGRKIDFPLIISGMIGGTERSLELNEILLTIAADLNLPIEVGSQEENLDNEEQAAMYVSFLDDDKDKDIFLLSNLSARACLDQVEKAMGQIKAQGISMYLNAAQEAVSFDGNTNFTGLLDNIEEIAKKHSDHLIVKEKSMGMTKKTVEKLVSKGVKYIDVSGYGGTNFIEMENLRNYRNDFSDLYGWGVPTAKAIINARYVSDDIRIIASGGIKDSLDIVKALILGADYVSVAGELLKYLLHGGYGQAKDYLEGLIHKTKILMFLLGAKNLDDLKNVDYKITGKLKEIL